MGNNVADGLFAGPGDHSRLDGDGRLIAVHRLLEAGLLFGLEERVVVERISNLVVPEGHRVLEP